jgi:hypothetical protein
MNSHVAASVLVLVVALLGGCLATAGGSPFQNGPAPDDLLTERPAPEPPGTVTAETAGSYAVAAEEVYRHNVIVAENEGVTNATVGCEVSEVAETKDGYRATVSCGFAYTFHLNGNVAIADGVGYEATYAVTGDGAERVGSTLR